MHLMVLLIRTELGKEPFRLLHFLLFKLKNSIIFFLILVNSDKYTDN